MKSVISSQKRPVSSRVRYSTGIKTGVFKKRLMEAISKMEDKECEELTKNLYIPIDDLTHEVDVQYKDIDSVASVAGTVYSLRSSVANTKLTELEN